MPMGPDRGESSGGPGSAHAITRSVRDSAALLDETAQFEILQVGWIWRMETTIEEDSAESCN
jgi:hypothetical protein